VAGTTTFAFPPATRNQGAGLAVAVRDISALTAYSSDTVSGLRVEPNVPVALQLLLPTETPDEGSPAGKIGPEGPLVAGSTYTITVRSVDAYWNLSPDGRPVRLTSNDIYAVHPPALPLDQGEVSISSFIASAVTSNLLINAIDDSNQPVKLSTHTSFAISVVPGAAEKMLFVLPGQYLVPGKVVDPYGVSGTISTQTAGNPFAAALYAADSRYNVVPGIAANIKITSDDTYAADIGNYVMVNGTMAITGATLRTAGVHRLTSALTSGYPLSAVQSGAFELVPNVPAKIRALAPGEQRDPGSATGRTHAPDAQKAGVPFSVTVDVTDNYWNLVPVGAPGASRAVSLATDDQYALTAPLPMPQVITSSGAFTVTPIRAGPLGISANSDPGGWTSNASAVSVSYGDAERMLLLMQGETVLPGSVTGKQGATDWDIRAGTNFPVKIAVVDHYFNLVPGWAADVKVETPTDAYAPAVATAAINTADGMTAAMNVNLRRAATAQLWATDLTSGRAQDILESTFTVKPGAPYGLQLLMPGETAVPGSGDYAAGANGKLSVVSTQTAGNLFSVTVNLVDRYLNRYTELAVGPTVYINTSDLYDQDGSTGALNNGTRQVPITMVTKTASANLKIYPVDNAANYACAGIACKNSDAAARASFKVYASTAAKLEVILAGESLVEGKCNISPPCRDANIANPGRSGTPVPYTIGSEDPISADVYLVDRFYNKVTEFTGAARDSEPAAVMPAVGLLLAQERQAITILNQTLEAGYSQFSFAPKTAMSSYTIVAATAAASAASYAPGVSTVTVYPGPALSLAYTFVSTVVTAGQPFSAALTALDAYGNICSTGPNVYLGTPPSDSA